MRALSGTFLVLASASAFLRLGCPSPSQPARVLLGSSAVLRETPSPCTVSAYADKAILSRYISTCSIRSREGTISASIASGRTRVPAAAAPIDSTRPRAKAAVAPMVGKSKSRGRGRGRKKEKATTAFMGGLEPAKLLEHADEIKLARQIQRLKFLEEIYLNHTAEMRSQHHAATAAVVGAAPGGEGRRQAVLGEETVAQAIVSEGGVSRAGWAALANVSIATLRVELREGKRARERMVESNVGLVGQAIQKLKRVSGGRLDSGTSEADLLQEGCISLLRAAERFDVSMGVRFSTYASYWVKAAIRRALQEQTRVVRLPSRVQNTYAKIKRVTDELSLREGIDGTVTDVAISEELLASGIKLSPARVRQIIHQVKVRPSSLDATLKAKANAGGDGSTKLLDLIQDERITVQADVVNNMLRSDLSSLMRKHLSDDEASMLRLRFGLADGEGRTIRQCGEEMNIGFNAAKSLLFSALSKMRRPHVAMALRDYMSDPDLEVERFHA